MNLTLPALGQQPAGIAPLGSVGVPAQMPSNTQNAPTSPPASQGGQMSSDQFASSIKAKYPQYQSIDNNTLTQKILTKYPQYNSVVQQQAPQNFLQQLGGAAQAVGNFAAPIVGDVYNDITGQNQKTGLQQLGDLGSTALTAATLIPGLGPEALAAKIGIGGAEGLGLAGRLGANAALGAGFGVTGALGAGQTNPGQIAQSAAGGAALGGGIGAASEALGGLLNKVAGRTGESQLTSQTNRLKTLQNSFADNSTATTNPVQTFEQNGFTKLLSVQDGKINAEGITNQNGTGALDNMLEDQSKQASTLVGSMEGGVPLETMKQQALDAVASNPIIRDAGKIPQAQAEVERRFASFQQSFGDTIPWKSVDNIRVAMNREFDPATRDVARTIGDTSRNFLYNGSPTNTTLRSAMQNETELIKARNFAEKLHGTTVKGGRLGKYMSEAGGGAVGAMFGSVGGPLGSTAGTLAGGYAGAKISDLTQRSFFNPIGAKTAGNVQSFLQRPASQLAGNAAKIAALKSLLQTTNQMPSPQ